MDNIEIVDFFDVDDNNSQELKEETYNNIVDIMKNYDTMKQHYTSQNKLTKVEKTKVVGIRAQQLAMGAKSLVNFPTYMTDHLERAEYELQQRKTPFIIKRLVCDHHEYWKLEDLVIS